MRNFAKLLSSVVLVGAVSVCTAANAVTAIYTISGNGSGSLNGISFENADYTFALAGDTANVIDNYFGYYYGHFQDNNNLTSATFTIAGVGSGTVSLATEFGEFYNQAYFGRADFGNDILDFYLPSETDITTTAGPLTGTGVYDLGQQIDTSAGELELDSSSDVTFSSLVPEPESWALLIAGIGLTGVALRRRQRTGVRLIAR
ncbi:PEPxxWA-CTERM sorting domain-containing protein [Phenylobacterium sp.]|uniref:PEPxxWA-CTERM sorting domain-containing protein n=1 Tax=Phenylobacterium sp. TaxID=1871053 RepID=UPI0025EE59F4|nr:PEPxxWA-CTERM sorting domain-containing protein [Phenylobacterium sp.]